MCKSTEQQPQRRHRAMYIAPRPMGANNNNNNNNFNINDNSIMVPSNHNNNNHNNNNNNNNFGTNNNNNNNFGSTTTDVLLPLLPLHHYRNHNNHDNQEIHSAPSTGHSFAGSLNSSTHPRDVLTYYTYNNGNDNDNDGNDDDSSSNNSDCHEMEFYYINGFEENKSDCMDDVDGNGNDDEDDSGYENDIDEESNHRHHHHHHRRHRPAARRKSKNRALKWKIIHFLKTIYQMLVDCLLLLVVCVMGCFLYEVEVKVVKSDKHRRVLTRTRSNSSRSRLQHNKAIATDNTGDRLLVPLTSQRHHQRSLHHHSSSK